MATIAIETDVALTRPDGTVLRADVYRPVVPGPLPVLLARTPYGKDSPVQLSILDPQLFARAGYLVVIQDTRGRGASDGEWLPLAFEAEDGRAAVDWAAALPGSDGRVLMYGASYVGNTQWAAASLRPGALLGIAPQVTWWDADDGLLRRGGAREHGFPIDWALRQAVPGAESLIREIDSSSGLRELPSAIPPALARHTVRTFDAQTPAPVEHPEVLGVPALHIVGWYDCFQQGGLDAFVAQRAAGTRTRLVVGPWYHHPEMSSVVGDVDFGLASHSASIGVTESLATIQRDWFDELTTGAGGADDLVRLFVMGANVWRSELDWPLARAVATPLYLVGHDGLAVGRPQSDTSELRLVSDPLDPVPTTGGAHLLNGTHRAGAIDQAPVEARDDVLVFTSEPLEQDLEVTGRVTAIIRGTADQAPYDWVVRLCDVDEAGRSICVVDGIRRVDDATETEHVVDLWSTSWVFRAGHQLRVHVALSSFPRWDRPGSETATDESQLPIIHQTLIVGGADGSRLVLPVIPA